MEGSRLDDIVLVERAVRGDEKAFQLLIERHRHAMYRIAYKITLHEDDALDVCQCVYLKLTDHLIQFHPSGSFKSWLATVTARTAIDFVRKAKRREIFIEPQELEILAESMMTEENPSSFDALTGDDELQRIQTAMKHLSSQQRAIFALRFEEELPLKEIAERLGIPNQQIRVQLCRAVKKLKSILNFDQGCNHEQSKQTSR